MLKIFSFVNVGERAGSGMGTIENGWAAGGYLAPTYEVAYGPDRTTLTVAVSKMRRVWLSVRAGRAEREEDRVMDLPESPKAGESLGRTQVIVICVLVAVMLAISLLPVLPVP